MKQYQDEGEDRQAAASFLQQQEEQDGGGGTFEGKRRQMTQRKGWKKKRAERKSETFGHKRRGNKGKDAIEGDVQGFSLSSAHDDYPPSDNITQALLQQVPLQLHYVKLY